MALAVLVGIATPVALALGIASSGGSTPSFTAGDLVVEVDQQTTTGNIVDPVDLVDYPAVTSGTSTPGGFAVDLPTASSGSNLPIVDYGDNENGGLITDSGDGGNIVLAGYEPSSTTVIGNTAPGTNHASPDVAAIVGSAGLVDTSTDIADGPTGTEEAHFARSATIATAGLSPAGTDVYVSGSQMVDELTDGTSQTSDNSIAADNSYDLQVVGGNLYESASSIATPSNSHGIIDQVGSGLPTSGPATDVPLVDSANASDTTHFSPEQFMLLTAGSAAVETIYVADNYANAGATGTNGAIEKYTCTSSCTSTSNWHPEGYVPLPYPTGLTAEETSSGVEIFATGGLETSSGPLAAGGSHLYSILDTSCGSSSSTCATTTLTTEVSSATSIATAPGDDVFHGVAFAPSNSNVPEGTNALPSVQQSALTLTSTSGTALTPLTPTASGGSGSGAVTYAVTAAGSANCTLTGGGTTVTASTAGTCTVTATKAGDTTYAPTSSSATTITFGDATPAPITLTSTSGVVGTALTLSYSGGSGSGAISYAIDSTGTANCSLTGDGTTLSASSAGTCGVEADQASDGTYAANSSGSTTVTFATPATLTLTSTSGTALTPLTLTYAGNITSGSAVYTLDSAGTADCSIINSDTQLSATSAGTCTVTVSGESTVQGQGEVSSPPTTVNFMLATPAPLTLTSTSGTALAPLTLTSKGGSGEGAITYAVDTMGTADCSLTGDGTSVTAPDAGTCTVEVDQGSDGTYADNSSEPTTVTFSPATQASLTLTSTSGVEGVQLALTANGGSGSGALSYAVTDPGSAGCVVTGGGTTVTATSGGTCSVTATQAADATYAATSSPATTVTFTAASPPTTSDADMYAVGTPLLAQITSSSGNTAPWNEYQGDGGAGETSVASLAPGSPGSVLPTYTPGGATVDGEPNVAVYPGSDSSTDGDSPYPAGVVGTPGTLDGYCGSGDATTEAQGAPVRQPAGTTLPLAPAYFPHIVRNSDGSLTGYFDYRPKDADEEIVAGTSTDNGKTWTYDSQALEQNQGYCPTGDTTDDGEGHPNVISVGGKTNLYTLPRAAGDNVGVGMLVHTITPTASNPLQGAPATEQTGIDPDDFASSAISVPYCSGATSGSDTAITADPCAGSSVTIPFTNPIGTGADAMNAGEFVDATATPNPTASDVIYCSGVSSASLTGCITNNSSGISVQSNDVVEQVIGVVDSDLAGSAEADSPVTDSLECKSGSPVPVSSTSGSTTMPCDVPAGPNTTNGDGGLGGFTLDADPTSSSGNFVAPAPFTAADDLVMNEFNNDLPMRLYIDGIAVYCTNSNFAPSTELENCTTGPQGQALEVQVGDPVISDPIVPATAEMTTGLVAPDGIVGALPSYPGAPAGSTIVMYTEKVLNYFDVGYLPAGTFGNLSSMTFTDFPNTLSAPLTPTNGVYKVTIGDFTAQVPVTVTCTGYTTTATTGTLTGCTNNAPAGDVITSKSYVEAPGSAEVPLSILEQIGEGKSGSKSGEKNFGNNEDLTVLRVAYTTNGVDFSTAGLANGGVISGQGVENGSTYNDISNPDQTASPTNLNQYTPGSTDATEMRFVGSAGSIVVNPDGSYGLFLSGAWAADGDSDSFNQVFYSSSTNGETWTTPVDVVSTDYTFAASVAQDASLNPADCASLPQGCNAPLGISAYYSGRAYAPSVVQNPDGTLTMLFAGDRVPKSIATAGDVLGTNSNSLYTVGSTDPALYRNILAVTLTSSTTPTVTTQTAVTASPASPVVGQTVTYTATVSVPSPGTGTPTGTVSFSGVAGCGAEPLNLGSPDTATCTTTYSNVESDAVTTATYSGDPNYSDSTQQTSVTVSQGTASTPSISDLPASGTYGGNSGTLTVSTDGDGTTSVTSSTPSVCAASGLVASYVGTGTCTLTAHVAAGTNYTAADGSPQSFTVSAATDTLTVTGSQTYGGSPNFSTSPSNGPTQPLSGSVTCTTVNGGTAIASSLTAGGGYTLDGGSCKGLSLTGSDTSNYILAYSGSTFTVSPANPSAPTISNLPSSSGQSSGFTATVSTTGDGTRSVTSSTSSVCTASGLAVSYVGPGTCTLTAHVAAGTDYTAADGSPQSFTVSSSSSSTVLTSSANPSVNGQPVTFTATVSASAPSFGTPTGTVTFTLADPAPTKGPGHLAALVCENGDVVALASGQATCTISSGLTLAQTPTTVHATYSGESGVFMASTATELTQAVDKSPSIVTISAKANPTVTSKAASFSAIVAAASPGAGLPTGTVTWTITSASGTVIPCKSSNDTVNKTSGKTTCSVATQELFAASGPYTVSVAYSGDANFLTSTGTFAQDISQTGSKVKLTVTPPASSGSPATVTATVTGTPASAGTPTGTVTFALTSATGSVVDCDTSNTSTLSSGTATCTVTSALVLSGSPYSVVATYNGDGNFTTSSSAAKAIRVPK